MSLKLHTNLECKMGGEVQLQWPVQSYVCFNLTPHIVHGAKLLETQSSSLQRQLVLRVSLTKYMYNYNLIYNCQMIILLYTRFSSVGNSL
jgi:hypothetical protein